MNSMLKRVNTNIKNNGFTIIEMVVYIALVSILLTVLFNVISFTFKSNNRLVAWSKVNSDTHSAIDRMTYEITNSQYIYLPTSNFSTTPDGQLSIVTEVNLSTNEQKAYIDFYLENGTIFLKKDGQSPVALTSADVSVSSLEFFYHKNGVRESVTIDLTINSAKSDMSDVSTHTINTIALRSI